MTKVIKDNCLKFDADLSLGEDTKFFNDYILREDRIGYLDNCLYHLTIRATDANMTSNANVELLMNNKIKQIDARKELDQKADSNRFDLY